MANRTVKDAKSIKGSNPQYLIEKIIRTRIYDCQYWKEKCFALTAELLVDEAMALDHIGGVFGGNIKPAPFLCLILKMLQIQPTKDIVIEFIKNSDYKYVRLLGALYLRIIGTAVECYKYLEPLYNDYRKIKLKNRQGKFELSYVDEFIDKLLRDDRVCDVILPRIQKRHILEETEQLGPRVSALDEDLEAEISEDEEQEKPPEKLKRSNSHSRSSSRSRSRSRTRHRSRSPLYKNKSKSPSHRHEARSKRTPSPLHNRHKSPADKGERRKSKQKKKEKTRSKKDRKHHEDKEREKIKDKDNSEKKTKKSKKKDISAEEEEEIRQANEMRAKLGLKPLQV